jgi:hypothetical protein
MVLCSTKVRLISNDDRGRHNRPVAGIGCGLDTARGARARPLGEDQDPSPQLGATGRREAPSWVFATWEERRSGALMVRSGAPTWGVRDLRREEQVK